MSGGDPRDYRLEISAAAQSSESTERDSQGACRPFLGVRFACCGTYQRIYRSADGTKYAGRCPRCMKAIEFKVGSGGVDSRFFVVD